MAKLTLRIGRDSALSFEEMDNNLLALDSDSPFKVSDGHITYEGKIGVGVDSTYLPTYDLDFGDGDSTNEATIGTNDADLHVHVDGARKLKVSTNAQERLTLTTDGHLGINQPNPEFPLDIDGNARIKGTFRGNQFRAFSFSDSDDLTISRGNITNARRIVSTDQVEFTRLYSRNTRNRIDHIDSVIVNDSNGLPTSRAVYSAMESDRTGFDLALEELDDKVDSQHAYDKEQYAIIYSALDSQQTVDRNNLQNLLAEIDSLGNIASGLRDSEHAWNVAEHDSLQSWASSNINRLDARVDSEHSWNISENNQLQNNIDSVNTSLNGHVNVINGKFDSVNNNLNQLQININNLDSDVFVRLDSLEESVVANLGDDLDSAVADLNAALDSEHAWNVAEHNTLQSNIDAEAQTRSDADSDLGARIDSEHAWNVA